MNRIIQYFPACCQHCREKERLQNRLDGIKELVHEIESEVGTDVFEFCVPGAEYMLRDRDDDAREPGVRLLLTVETELADINGDVRQYAIDELRRLASKLLETADRLDGVAP